MNSLLRYLGLGGGVGLLFGLLYLCAGLCRGGANSETVSGAIFTVYVFAQPTSSLFVQFGWDEPWARFVVLAPTLNGLLFGGVIGLVLVFLRTFKQRRHY